MVLIYRITTMQEWEEAKEKGYYTAPSLEAEGFIHCSQEQQVQAVLKRYYSDKKELLELIIDPQKLKAKLNMSWLLPSKKTFLIFMTR